GCPSASTRSASCASTASGVFKPCARSPAFASALLTICSRCSSKELRSFTNGCTSIGYVPSILRPEPSRTPDNCLRKRPKGASPARICQIPASRQKNAKTKVVPVATEGRVTRPRIRQLTPTNPKYPTGIIPTVKKKAPERIRQRKERSQFMNQPSCDNPALAPSQ